MRIVAIITEPGDCKHPGGRTRPGECMNSGECILPGECKHSLEVNKILECLKRNHASPFDKVVTKAS